MPGPDVATLLDDASDDYGDDFEGDQQPSHTSGASILAAAALKVDKEEKTEGAAQLKHAAKALDKSIRPADPLASAAEEYAAEQGGGGADSDDDEDADKETVARSVSLQVACFRSDLRNVELALDKGASLRHKDRHGWTCIHWAASSNAHAILKLLLKRASGEMTSRQFKKLVNGHAADTGWTPLHVAVVKGSLDCIELLLDNPCTKPETKDYLGETAADCIPAERSPTWNSVRRALGVVLEETKPKKELAEAKGGDEDEGMVGGGSEGEGKDDDDDRRASKK